MHNKVLFDYDALQIGMSIFQDQHCAIACLNISVFTETSSVSHRLEGFSGHFQIDIPWRSC